MPLYTNTYYLSNIIPTLNYSLKHTSTLQHPQVVEFRIKALTFWQKYGIEAAMDYSGYSKSSLYRWRKQLEDSRQLDKRIGRASLKALDPKVKRPKHCRVASWNHQIIDYIKQQATKHYGIGRRKLHQLLSYNFRKHLLVGKCPSESTVGRILNWLRANGKIKHSKRLSFNARTGRLHVLKRKVAKKLRRKDLPFKVKRPGDLVQIDGVEGHYLGKHFYMLDCIDYVSEKAYAIILPSKSSTATASVLPSLEAILGFKIKAIQTDNGSEFAARFHETATRLGFKHCFNYVKKPIYNGKVERFNITIQQELFHNPDFNYLLVEDKVTANQLVRNFLDYYNNERPHSSLKQQDENDQTIYLTPNEYVLQWSLT